MYIVPSMSTELGRETNSKKELEIIKFENRLVITTENVSGGFSSATVVPFKSKEEENMFVLEEEEKNSNKTSHSSLTIYLTFATRTITYCMYNGKKIKLKDKTKYEAPYIFDGQSGKNNEIHVVPASKLSGIIDLSNCSEDFQRKVQENPDKMCMVYYHNSNIMWLDNGYVMVSKLKEVNFLRKEA